MHVIVVVSFLGLAGRRSARTVGNWIDQSWVRDELWRGRRLRLRARKLVFSVAPFVQSLRASSRWNG